MIAVRQLRGLAELNRTVRRYAAETGRDVGAEVRIAGRNLAVNLANLTMPRNQAGVSKMRDAISQDAARTYATPATVYTILNQTDPVKAQAYWSIVSENRGSVRRVQQVLRDTPLAGIPIAARVDPAIQKAARTGRRRRVRVRQPRQILTRDAGMRAHVNRLYRKIGSSAAGWAHVARGLGGTRGIPAYKNVGRHKRQTGRASVSGNRRSGGVVLHNMVSYVANNLPASRINMALRRTNRALMQRLKVVANRRRR